MDQKTNINVSKKFEHDIIDFSNMDKRDVMKYFGYDEYGANLLKTKDAKQIFNAILKLFQGFFKTKYAKQKLYMFFPVNELNEIEKRFKFIEECLNVPYDKLEIEEFFSFELPNVNVYDVCFLTRDYKKYEELLNKYRNFPIFLVENNDDLNIAKDYVQVRTDDPEISELLPNAVLVDEPFPEYHVKRLYQVKEFLRKVKDYLPEEYQIKIDQILNFEFEEFNFIQWFQHALKSLNEKLKEKIKQLNFEGEEIINLIQDGKNKKLEGLILDSLGSLEKEIKEKFNVNIILADYLELKYPLTIEEIKLDELNKLVQSEKMYHDFHRFNELYKQIGDADQFVEKIKYLLSELDFKVGIKNIIKRFELKKPKFVEKGFRFKNGKNIFLLAKNINVEPVEYDTVDYDLILLTGANSGGKTTLLQLISQIHILAKSGFYVPANAEIELIDELYYFSKPTGRTDAGAFETLLKTFAGIKSLKRKLILADEIEAITEPGAAAKILIGILEWFKDKNAKVILVTHLGDEIKEHVSSGIRFDGIQAIGIENGMLIVNRSPIKNIIAKSTPELIIEKLKNKDEFFKFIYKKMKGK